MKILIVYSGNVIFSSLAQKLGRLISKKSEVVIAKENIDICLTSVLSQRIQRCGFLKGVEQFLFKIFDNALLSILNKSAISF